MIQQITAVFSNGGVRVSKTLLHSRQDKVTPTEQSSVGSLRSVGNSELFDRFLYLQGRD
jgi:hypothetical protein